MAKKRSDNQNHHNNRLAWLEAFESLANDVLSAEEDATAAQIQILVKNWYENTQFQENPETDETIQQAMLCLTSEVMADIPERFFQVLSQTVDDEEVSRWIYSILMMGRFFEQSLQEGRLNDLSNDL
ncbi:MAG TPA: hypothetical protein VJZ27_08925 [Aggregatilineales bacterium]|nr:hypothetical protein [Aggregatilineales bacterium]